MTLFPPPHQADPDGTVGRVAHGRSWVGRIEPQRPQRSAICATASNSAGVHWDIRGAIRDATRIDGVSQYALMNLTLDQRTNLEGVPKAAELIEISGGHALEASDRAIMNMLYQHAHDSGRLADPTAHGTANHGAAAIEAWRGVSTILLWKYCRCARRRRLRRWPCVSPSRQSPRRSRPQLHAPPFTFFQP